VSSSSWKLLAIPAVAVLALGIFVGALGGHERSDFDERIPVGPGGSLEVEVALGDGISFDRGSLEIRSHEDGDVRVLADTSGWGAYAVDLDLSHEADRVKLVGRVEGALHWLFGGPTVDVSIWVPREFSVQARMTGGPLVLEDLEGAVQAHADDGDVEVAGVRGSVAVTVDHGSVEVQSVTGPVEVESRGGRLHGGVDVRSVTGPLTIRSERGQVEIDGVRGDVALTTDRADIEAEDVRGDVVASSQRGDIVLEEIAGSVRATSGRGSIEVEFSGPPQGAIETGRGGIEVRVPAGAGFDLDARTERGEIEVEPGSGREEDDGSLLDRDAAVVRAVHGGGSALRLRTGRGSIRISE
jgi:hypothetical protein